MYQFVSTYYTAIDRTKCRSNCSNFKSTKYPNDSLYQIVLKNAVDYMKIKVLYIIAVKDLTIDLLRKYLYQFYDHHFGSGKY